MYQAIAAELRRSILASDDREGKKLPSDAQLSERFGVSRLTLIRALQELQSEGLVIRRVGSGTFVRPRIQAASKVFGLLAPSDNDLEIFGPVCQAVAQAAQHGRHALLWGNFADPSASFADHEEHAKRLVRLYTSQNVAGVFFAAIEYTPHQHAINHFVAATLEQAGIPIVLIDRCIREFPDRSRHDLVGIDNYRGGYRLARHLLDAGCSSIAFFARPYSAPTVAARIAGYRSALANRGIQFDPSWEVHGDPSDSHALDGLLRNAQPDAIVCANDRTAGFLMHALQRRKIRIPRDIRLVGFDDICAKLLPVPLTTLRQPCRELADAAIRVMLDRLENPDMATRDVLLECELVVRESCGASPGKPYR